MVERLTPHEAVRETFRDTMSDVAWQKHVRDAAIDRYAGREWWADVDLSLKRAVVRPTTRTVAEKIILEYEWLGTLPFGCKRYYGIFFDGWACGGVVCFADGGANLYAHKEFGIAPTELSYLARGACTHWTPTGTGSKLIAHALRLEAQLGAQVALAYSDTDAGEIGTLYQATNWLCLGRGGSTYQFIHPQTDRVYDMKIVHDMRVRAGIQDTVSWSQMRDYLVEQGWRVQLSNPKYRYAYILASGEERASIQARIRGNFTPYPKRSSAQADTARGISIDSDAPHLPVGNEGGASPTVTLPSHPRTSVPRDVDVPAEVAA